MRKTLIALMAVVLFISGCIANMAGRNDVMERSFAYVVCGTASGQSLEFTLDGKSEGFDEHNYFSSSTIGYYTVYKVYPGRYTAPAVELSGDRKLSNSSRQPMATVYLEAGKLTYVGDITFDISGAKAIHPRQGTPGMASALNSNAWHNQSVRVRMDVQNNSEAVKNAIRKGYPGLAQELDTLFVYRQAQ